MGQPFSPRVRGAQRAYWLLLAGLLIFSAALLSLRAQRGFDAVDHDEVYLMGQSWLLYLGRPDLMRLIGYPPGLFLLYTGLQRLIAPESTVLMVEAVLLAARLLTAVMALLAGVAAALCAQQFSQRRTLALAVAALWGLLPVLQTQASYAFSEPWQALGYGLVLLLCWHSLQRQQLSLLIPAVIIALAAIVMKYPAAPILGLPLGSALWLTRRRWRAGLLTIMIQMLLIGLAAYLLLFVYGSFSATQTPVGEAGRLAASGPGLLFNPEQIMPLLSNLPRLLSLPAPLFYGLLLVGLPVLLWQNSPTARVWWGLLIVTFIAQTWLTSAYWIFEFLLPRYLLPAAYLALLLLAGSALALLRLLRFSPRWQKTLIIIGVVIWVLPGLSLNLNAAADAIQPNTRNEALEWVRTSLPYDSTFLVTGFDFVYLENDFTFFPQPRVWTNRPLLETSPAEWLAMNVQYAYVSDAAWNQWPQTPGWESMQAEVMVLHAFPPPDDLRRWTGEPLRLVMLRQPQQTLDVRFGESITLIGADLEAAAPTPGSTILLRTYWRAEQPVERDYLLRLELTPHDSETPLAHVSGNPGQPLRPTSTWSSPHEVLISSPLALTLPADLPTGTYNLRLSLTDANSGAPLMLADGQPWLILQPLVVGT